MISRTPNRQETLEAIKRNRKEMKKGQKQKRTIILQNYWRK